MKFPSMKGRLPLLLGGVAVLAAVGAVGVFFRRLIPYLLIALLVVGVIWIAAHFAMVLWRRRRQRSFDAGVAAKEGIDDRRREWASWTEELNRQGIDRYELPFYLLVGEPQSGKSVLLQNSELHFPFGQTRLSGVGGTRGCDWWFTEEAVILDLAGRLFTHEGGASDALEWGAFLELLSGFRPLCPANGVMLVIPCDSLLLDSREESTRKASRMQEAMLTLTSKLQAQLPIYVILTKGDRVFGFAETVHRLDSEKRQQMFGWSRRAEDFEQPFDMVEVREAFGDIVGRTRLLRETMLSTLRLPEGLPEADRVYALPDELEALMPNFEVYLKRIFSESTLVDRLYFRGFYLTSGLQIGAPIAKVCSKLLGGEGDADKRNLEALFSKQQAYFIKDLIRRRVFSERGLVRPTKKRVARAQKSAWIGYGTAAVIALVSVVWSAAYVLGDYQEQELNAFQDAIVKGRGVAALEDPEPAPVMAAMQAAWRAKEVAPRSIEELGENRQESFVQLYQRLCDERLVPSLRGQAERDLLAGLGAEATQPGDADAFLRRVDRALVLLRDWRPLESAPLLGGRTQEELAEVDDLVAVIDDPELIAGAAELLARRKEIAVDMPTSTPRRSGGRLEGALADAVAWLDGQWDRLLTFSDTLQVHGQVGCLIAWWEAMEAREQLAQLTTGVLEPVQDDNFAASIARLLGAADYLRQSTVQRNGLVALPEGGVALDIARLRVDLEDVASVRAGLATASGRAALEAETEWAPHAKLLRFLKAQLAQTASEGAPTDPGALEGRLLVNGALVAHPLVFDVAAAAFLPPTVDAPKGLPGALEQARERVDPQDRTGLGAPDLALAQGVFRAKVRMLHDAYVAAYRDADSLALAVTGARTDELDRARRLEVLAHIVELHGVLRGVVAGDVAARWRAHLAKLAAETLDDIDAVAVGASETTIRAELLTALEACHAELEAPELRERILRLTQEHARGVSEQALAALRALPRTGPGTEQLVREIDSFLKTVERPPSAAPNARLLAPSELEAWSNDARALVRERLAHHVENVRAKSTLPTIVGASARAADVEKRISAGQLLEWQGTCDLPDLEQPEAKDARKSLADRELTKGTAEAVEEFLRQWGRSAAPHRNERADALRQVTEALSVDVAQPALTGAQVAAALKKHLEGRRAEQGAALGSAAEYYLEQLTTDLEAECRSTLRGLYVAELTALVDRRPAFKQALYMTQRDHSELDRIQRQLAVDLARLYDPDSEFDKLQAAYQQAAGTLVDFRPASGAATGPAAVWWAFDEFLRELRAFIQGDDAGAKVAICTVDVWLEPNVDRTGVWTRPHLFTNFESSNPDNLVNAGNVKRVGPLKWGFDGEAEKRLWLRWSTASSRKLDDDIEVELESCFAPLLMAWESDMSDDERRRWEVTADTVKSTSEEARFVLEFGRPLPARPARPW